MRLAVICSLLAIATVVAIVSTLGLRAQEEGATLYVSGLGVGRGHRAILRLRNASPDGGDVFSVHYTVRHTDAGQALSFPGAGDGARLVPGQLLELDLGAIVNGFRAGRDLGDFTGPIQLVAFGTGGVSHSFGPDTVIVEAIQIDGGARFKPLIEWR